MWIVVWWECIACTPHTHIHTHMRSIILRHSIQLSVTFAVDIISCSSCLVWGHLLIYLSGFVPSVWEIVSLFPIFFILAISSFPGCSIFDICLYCLLTTRMTIASFIAMRARICRIVWFHLFIYFFLSFLIICNCATVSVYISVTDYLFSLLYLFWLSPSLVDSLVLCHHMQCNDDNHTKFYSTDYYLFNNKRLTGREKRHKRRISNKKQREHWKKINQNNSMLE